MTRKHRPSARRPRPLHGALAVSLALASLAVAAQGAAPAPIAAEAAARAWNLPSAPLADTLARIARDSGQRLSADPALIAGKTAAPVRGNLNPTDAARQALIGTGLELVVTEGGTLSLRPAPVRTQDGEATLAPMTVTAARLRGDITSEGTGSYAARGASILKGVQSLKEIPQSVSVITRQQMEDQGFNNVSEAIKQAPGIYATGGDITGPNDFVSAYFSRGFQINSYMLDGVAANAMGTSTEYNQALNGSSAIYDRVEVLRGAAGLLVGNGTPGGTINLVRKRPTENFQQNYALSAGSWNSYRGEADISGPLNEAGTLRGRLVAAYEDRERFWDVTSSKSPLLYGILEADITPATRVGLGVRHEEYKEDAPRMSYFYQMDYTPGRSKLYNPDWGYRDTENDEVFFDLRHDINDKWRASLSATHHAQKNESLGPRTLAQVPGLLVEYFAHKTKTDSFDLNVTGAFNALGREHKVAFGVNGSKQEGEKWGDAISSWWGDFNFQYDWNTFDHRTSFPYDAWMRNRVSAMVASARNSRVSRHELKSHGLYGKLDFKLTDDLTAILGGRSSTYRYDQYLWHVNNGARNPSGSGKVTNEFTPYAGLVYALNRQWSAYASYADIFNPQWGQYTLGGSLIDHEIGKNFELGIKGELYGGRLNTAFAIYQVDLENTAQSERPPYDEVCPGNPTGGGCSIAIGHKRTRGFDAEVSGEPLPGWQASAGYTYTQTKILKADADIGNSFSQTPRHMLKLFSSYQLDGQWTLGGGVQAQSREITGDKWFQGGYALWSGFARYRVNRNLDVSLNVNNIFDKKYWPNGQANTKHQWGDPRSYLLTLRAKF